MIQNTPLDLSIKSNPMPKETSSENQALKQENQESLQLQKVPSEMKKDFLKNYSSSSCGFAPELAEKRSHCEVSFPHSSGSYHDESCRRHRTAFTRSQTSRLEKEFQRDNYLSRSKRIDLARELNLYENTIKVKMNLFRQSHSKSLIC